MSIFTERREVIEKEARDLFSTILKELDCRRAMERQAKNAEERELIIKSVEYNHSLDLGLLARAKRLGLIIELEEIPCGLRV